MDENGTQKNLAAKIVEVIKKTGAVEKGGFNEFFKYAYLAESDLLEALRGVIAEVGLAIIPDCVEHNRIDSTNAKGEPVGITAVMMAYTLIDTESGESMTIHFPGQGVDTQDKGGYKAMTGANKYAFMKLFQIPTKDDPEKGSDTDKSGAKGSFSSQRKSGPGGKGKPSDKQLQYMTTLANKLDREAFPELAEKVDLFAAKPEQTLAEASGLIDEMIKAKS